MLTMAGLAKLAYTQCLKIIEDESLIAFYHANGLTKVRIASKTM